jgi:hypothetical protein
MANIDRLCRLINLQGAMRSVAQALALSTIDDKSSLLYTKSELEEH